jgi:hypothetical protein
MRFALKIWACIVLQPNLCHACCNEDQKENCVDLSKELVNHENADENFLKNIIPSVETWVYGYDVKTKAQSSQLVSRTSPRPKKVSSVQCEDDADFFFVLMP